MTIVKVIKKTGRKFLILKWIDPETGKERERSSKQTRRREAEKEAARLSVKISLGSADENETHWSRFCDRYEAEHFVGLSSKYFGNWRSAKHAIEKHSSPLLVQKINASFVSRLSANLHSAGYSPETVRTYLRHLNIALQWAKSVDIIRDMPNFPRQLRQEKLMRGRPITGEEFDRMLAAVPHVRQDDAPQWQLFITALWNSGLRCSEALHLSWDDNALLRPVLDGGYPRFWIHRSLDKGKRDRLFPMAPEFFAMLENIPACDRNGYLFVPTTRDGKPFAKKTASRTVAKFGARANVIVDHQKEEFASAHDLRRSFGTRWARRVVPAVLQQLMRHSSIETTMRHYVGIDDDSLSSDIWTSTVRAQGGVLGGGPAIKQ